MVKTKIKNGWARVRRSVIMNRHGYLKVQVGLEHPMADADGFAYLHKMVWATAYGPVPYNHAVHCRNGNQTDVRLSNLELVSWEPHQA